MKTTQDLFEELLRYIFEGGGAPPSEIEVKILQFRQKFGSKLKDKPLTDAEYSKKLQQMKLEAPAFLHYLLHEHQPPGHDLD